VFIKNAWVGDDAYILFRSLDQLLDGNGPRWNPHERVQVFTCPLWYWLLAGAGLFSRNHYLNSIVLSAACNVLLLWNMKKILGNALKWILAIVMLVFSQAFFDFTSSGLENPLAYCLLSFIARFYLNTDKLPAEKAVLLTCAASGLLLVTRHDLALFVIPLLVHSLYQTRPITHTSTTAIAAALMPLFCWTLFALIYYGFPFPNTAYAKLGTSIPHTLLMERGLLYFQTSVLRDFPSVFLLIAGILSGIMTGNVRIRFITLGIVLHLAYVFWIGGDFMRGRFFSWDFLLATVALLYQDTPTLEGRWINRTSVATVLTVFAAIISLKLFWPAPIITPFNWGTQPFKNPDTADGITQERSFYYWFTGFWKFLQRDTALLEDHGWCQDSIEQKKEGLHVAAAYTVGFRGYCLGNNDIVVDMLGITDPLLARMPRNPQQKNWRPGHFMRLLPEGYCTSLKLGENRIQDAGTREFYENIRLLTQNENLFSKERLLTIWHMNTGFYREELADINKRMTDAFMQENGIKNQTSAQRDCPFIELPDNVIEQLKKY
jgi:arabinofuranosyltransferase